MVSRVISSHHLVQINATRLYQLANPVMPYVNVFRAAVINLVQRNVDSAFRITMHVSWLKFILAKDFG